MKREKKERVDWPEVLLYVIVGVMIIITFVSFLTFDAAKKETAALQEQVISLEREILWADSRAQLWENSFHRFYVWAEDWPMRDELAEKAILYSRYEIDDPNGEWSMQERRAWSGRILVTSVRQKIFTFRVGALQDPDLGYE